MVSGLYRSGSGRQSTKSTLPFNAAMAFSRCAGPSQSTTTGTKPSLRARASRASAEYRDGRVADQTGARTARPERAHGRQLRRERDIQVDAPATPAPTALRRSTIAATTGMAA